MRKHGGDKLIELSAQMLELMRQRKSVRDFSNEEIPPEVIRNCIALAGTAPSGANMQPWTFIMVRDRATKSRIRKAAESVESEFYTSRISEDWRDALKPLGMTKDKPFLEEAPYLICVFMKKYDIDKKGAERKVYYPHESVGIATGFLLSALHSLGIGTLTYTPAPMTFLKEILSRPENETPYMIVVAGFEKEGVSDRRQSKKSIDEIMLEI